MSRAGRLVLLAAAGVLLARPARAQVGTIPTELVQELPFRLTYTADASYLADRRRGANAFAILHPAGYNFRQRQDITSWLYWTMNPHEDFPWRRWRDRSLIGHAVIGPDKTVYHILHERELREGSKVIRVSQIK